MNYRVEVAILFSDKTWDTVFLNVDSENEESAKLQAEETVKNTSRNTVSHVTAVLVQPIEEDAS